MIRKVLIANRGEIAVRIIQAARLMDIRTVAIFSQADEHMSFVRLADEAVYIGESEPTKSYLRQDAIIEICKHSGADAVHPGYGFLSERADFSESCANAGLTFIGPTAAAMRKLGAKIESKQLAVASNVPITPGYFEPGASAEQLAAAAQNIGYPVMLKASAGGGGRGMRIVRDPADFHQELRIASDEALKGFGDGAMMVEKLVERPRHIEIQILADHHGNVAALYERECSLQRRHQKLVEEAPSPYLLSRPDVWDRMRGAAISLARAAGYTNAGTCEFILDEHSGEFYFLEVNARLQVEHPVTEAVTGLDLVQWQFRIAQGETLNLSPDLMSGARTAMNGHAIEARIVAEDPALNFMPAIGRIVGWREPKIPGVRIDTGYGEKAEVSRFYDSLLAKVIAHGETREVARNRLIEALREFHILGIKTNIEYLLDVIQHPEFATGNFDTGFLEREYGNWQPNADFPAELGDIVQAASVETATSGSNHEHAQKSSWALKDGFRNVSV